MKLIKDEHTWEADQHFQRIQKEMFDAIKQIALEKNISIDQATQAALLTRIVQLEAVVCVLLNPSKK